MSREKNMEKYNILVKSNYGLRCFLNYRNVFQQGSIFLIFGFDKTKNYCFIKCLSYKGIVCFFCSISSLDSPLQTGWFEEIKS